MQMNMILNILKFQLVRIRQNTNPCMQLQLIPDEHDDPKLFN